MLKLGLDFHGVIDTNPQLFSILSKRFIIGGGEVHILTGSSITDDFRKQLIEYEIHWTHLFSITDYHKENKTPMTFDKNGHPWIEEEAWNKTKADYCNRMNIDIHFDDSKHYGQYFDTPFFRYDHNEQK